MVNKLIYSLVLIFISSFGFSQKPADFKISISEYQKAQNIKELIKDFPADCDIRSCLVTVTVNGVLVETSSKKGQINWNRQNAAAKDKVIIEDLQTTCKGKLKSKYKIIVE
jgi:hypothetical protein